MTGLHIGLGTAMIIIAFAYQWLVSKRVKHQQTRKLFAWTAWFFAAVGGAAIGTDIGHQLGISSVGAIVASFIMIGFIWADLRDHRPDWPAFILVTLAPTFMRLSGGGFGALFHLTLSPLDALVGLVGRLFGA